MTAIKMFADEGYKINRILWILVVIATVSQPVWAVINGDFSSGNTGFSTEFIYSPSDLGPHTTYAIVANPASLHSAWASYGDHTTGNGLMMAVNGCDSIPKIVWSQTVPVTRNTSYQFSTWVASSYRDARAILRVTINGTIVISGFESTSLGVWQQASALWSSSTNTTARIDITDIRCVGGGNDYALDDISFFSLGDYAIAGSGYQIPDGSGRIRVDYQLSLPNGTYGDVSVAFSANGGVTWNIVPQNGSLSGDYGSGISSGSRSIQWNAAAQLTTNAYNNNFRARLVTTAAGATITNISAPFTIDLRGLQGGLTVAGKVRNAATGQGLNGVSVSLAGQNTSTTSDGSYSFTNVILANGNTITASKLGYATYSGTISAPVGGVQSVPQDISLRSASGSLPIVSTIRPAVQGIFIETIPVLNEYTAVVDWRGSTPQNVEFYVNGALKQTVPTTSTEAKATMLNMGQLFFGSYRLGANKVSAIAVSDAGRSAQYDLPVTVIPKPSFFPVVSATQGFSYNNPKFAVEFVVPPGDLQADSNLPIPGMPIPFGFVPSARARLEYAISSGAWDLKFGGGPRLILGPVGPFEIGVGGHLTGFATFDRGIIVDTVHGRFYFYLDQKIWTARLTQAIPPAEVVATLLDVVKIVGIDPNSIQSINIYARVRLDADFDFDLPRLAFKPQELQIKVGPKIAYEPDLKVAKLEVYGGGYFGGNFDLDPFGLNKLMAEMYIGCLSCPKQPFENG